MSRAPVPQLKDHPTATSKQDALYDARALTDGGATAKITLEGKTYTLRITRAGKLILTK